MNYVIKDGELRHYGVLGMKWGVRRNRSKAYAKAARKADRLEEKSTELDYKAAKLQKKALKKEAKATNEKQYQKARKMQFKANKKKLKAAKLAKKNLKWKGKMETAFADVKISEISPESRDLGKRYVYMLSK